MPWKKVSVMEERLRFVLRAVEPGAKIAPLCREFGISRETGHKILKRYKEEGFYGIKERTRRPHHSPREVSSEIVCRIVSLRAKYPRWGGVTIRDYLSRELPCREVPSSRTIDRILDKCGLTVKKRRRRKKAIPDGILRTPERSNDVWTVDFKGWWRTKDNTRCNPLTIRDEFSTYIIDLSALEHPRLEPVKERFSECFYQYGLPKYIRSDNGPPFASIQGLNGLSQLSVWWIKHGIIPERILPGNPQMNGGHERMHRDIKADLQMNPAQNLSAQQDEFDSWRKMFNEQRPHRKLGGQSPASVYRKSKRKYVSEEKEYDYPSTMSLRKVDSKGLISRKDKKYFISRALAGEVIGIHQEDGDFISLWFCNYYLGKTNKDFSIPLRG